MAAAESVRSARKLAICAVVAGLLWLFWVGSALALVFGVVALRRSRATPSDPGAERLAYAGITLGVVGLLTLALYLASLVFTAGTR